MPVRMCCDLLTPASEPRPKAPPFPRRASAGLQGVCPRACGGGVLMQANQALQGLQGLPQSLRGSVVEHWGAGARAA